MNLKSVNLNEVIWVWIRTEKRRRTESWSPPVLRRQEGEQEPEKYTEKEGPVIQMGNHRRVKTQRPNEAVFTGREPLCYCYSYILFCFWSHHMISWSSVPWPGIRPRSQQWKPRILTTRPPGNSCYCSYHWQSEILTSLDPFIFAFLINLSKNVS